MRKSIITETIAVLFILLFVYAATSKLIDYQKFMVQLGQSPLLTAYARWVAWFIPVIEIMIALMLLIPKYQSIGMYMSFGLMVMFSAYIIAITRFSDYVPCSCGGILQKMTWGQHFIFNMVFVLLALVAIVLEQVSATREIQRMQS